MDTICTHIPAANRRAKLKHNTYNILDSKHAMIGVVSVFFGLLHGSFLCWFGALMLFSQLRMHRYTWKHKEEMC